MFRTPHRRSRRRPARVHRSRPAVRRASRRRRAPSRIPLLIGAIAAALIAVVLAAVLAPRSAEAQPAGITLLGTIPTTTDSRVDLPTSIKKDLVDLALAHGTLTRVTADGDGAITSSTVDLTPRQSGAGSKAVQTEQRARPMAERAADAQLALLQQPRTGADGRSLFGGLHRLTLQRGDRLIIVSSGLDTADPLDFRALAWKQSPEKVVASLKADDRLPDLPAKEVEFVLVPPTGDQPQLVSSAKAYLKSVWRAVLTASGAQAVHFVELQDDRGAAPSVTTTAPIVPVPAAGSTSKPVRCSIANSAFEADTATLLDERATTAGIARCAAVDPADVSSIDVEAWTSYTPPLTAGQQASDLRLSAQRARAVQRLLQHAGLPAALIHLLPHGSQDQPHPQDPTSAANRIARVTVHLRS